MKFLVTGVLGQLGFDVMNELAKRGYEAYGSDIAPEFRKQEGDYAINSMPYVQMDITDKESVSKIINDIKPDHIIHCAAWTAVDAAEDEENKPKVMAVNVDGCENIAKAAKDIDAVMTYISTDYVFSGQGESLGILTARTMLHLMYMESPSILVRRLSARIQTSFLLCV